MVISRGKMSTRSANKAQINKDQRTIRIRVKKKRRKKNKNLIQSLQVGLEHVRLNPVIQFTNFIYT